MKSNTHGKKMVIKLLPMLANYKSSCNEKLWDSRFISIQRYQ